MNINEFINNLGTKEGIEKCIAYIVGMKVHDMSYKKSIATQMPLATPPKPIHHIMKTYNEDLSIKTFIYSLAKENVVFPEFMTLLRYSKNIVENVKIEVLVLVKEAEALSSLLWPQDLEMGKYEASDKDVQELLVNLFKLYTIDYSVDPIPNLTMTYENESQLIRDIPALKSVFPRMEFNREVTPEEAEELDSALMTSLIKRYCPNMFRNYNLNLLAGVQDLSLKFTQLEMKDHKSIADNIEDIKSKIATMETNITKIDGQIASIAQKEVHIDSSKMTPISTNPIQRHVPTSSVQRPQEPAPIIRSESEPIRRPRRIKWIPED
jgi:hypothetical protein